MSEHTLVIAAPNLPLTRTCEWGLVAANVTTIVSWKTIREQRMTRNEIGCKLGNGVLRQQISSSPKIEVAPVFPACGCT